MRRILAVGALLAALLGAPSAAQALGPGIVKGTVKPEAIAAEVEVCVLEGQSSETCTYPAPDGTYTLRSVPVGANVIEFVPSYRSNYVTQYYNHAAQASEATKIQIEPGHQEQDEVDADLQLGGQLQGLISAASGGAPITGVEVCALSAIDVQVGCTHTDATGHYALPTLPTGNYKVGFFGRGASADYVSEYYGGSPSYAASPPISVMAGATVLGLDAELERGGSISGTVNAAPGGAHLAGISVCLFAVTAQRPQQCRFSDDAGEYSFTGLASGSFKVGFSLSSTELAGEGGATEEDVFLSQYYAGGATLAGATQISVSAPASVNGVDASLLTPQVPPPAPPVALPNQVVPPPVPISEPVAKKKSMCRWGYRKRKVKGKTRCVKVRKKRGRGSGKGGKRARAG